MIKAIFWSYALKAASFLRFFLSEIEDEISAHKTVENSLTELVFNTELSFIITSRYVYYKQRSTIRQFYDGLLILNLTEVRSRQPCLQLLFHLFFRILTYHN